MKTSIHRVEDITKSKIKKRRLEDGSASYCMTITITYNDLSDCKGLKGSYYDNSDKTMFGEVEVVTRLTLFAETREALKLKAEALS
tara:strand:- start:2353 stop:2610 length:258 start_codon:yes stop_codon:yes gene_type:complete